MPQRRNLRREFITMDELNEKLREQGIEKMTEVKVAYLEGDGQISVIRNPGCQGSGLHCTEAGIAKPAGA